MSLIKKLKAKIPLPKRPNISFPWPKLWPLSRFSEIFRVLFPCINTMILIWIPMYIKQIILPLSTTVKLITKLNFKLLNFKEVYLPDLCWTSSELIFLSGCYRSFLFPKNDEPIILPVDHKAILGCFNGTHVRKRRLAFGTLKNWLWIF